MKEIAPLDLHAVVADLLAAAQDPARKVRLRVTSGSMRPLIQPGDTLVCAPAALEQLRRGDILIVRRSQDFLAHRLIRKQGDAWYTKGDRSRSLDAPVPGTQILARVTQIEPADGGRVVELTRWEQRILQRMRGWWGAAVVTLFEVARALLRRRNVG